VNATLTYLVDREGGAAGSLSLSRERERRKREREREEAALTFLPLHTGLAHASPPFHTYPTPDGES
jgi:hypothetical protein